MSHACVFSIDDAYVVPFQVFFHSLEITSSLPKSVEIYILHTDALSSVSIDRLRLFLDGYGRAVSFVDAASLMPERLPIRAGDHVSPATFYRLFVASILPASLEQIVYLDSDMLALRSIADLFSWSVDGLLAAVDHCRPADAIRLWGDCGGDYFQAGVLVIPLRLWREEKLLDRFLDVLNYSSHLLKWWDQDVLNLALRGQWQRLPVWMNVCEDVYRCLDSGDVDRSAALIHYSGSAKPWNAYQPSPFTAHWDQVYLAVFGQPFDREQFLPPPPPVLARRTRLKQAVLSRVAGLIHGRV